MTESEAMQKVAFTQNAQDEETRISYARGQVVDLPSENAQRLASAGVAVVVEAEELEQQKAEELDRTAEGLGIDTTGEQKKVDKVKMITGEK